MVRRHVLKLLALAAATACVAPARAIRALDALGRVRVPPTVMLHARQAHLDNLPRLLDWLFERGYTPITYQTLWECLAEDCALPTQPVILTIDDLTLVRGSRNFPFIARMVDVLLEYEAPGVLGIITQPVTAGAGGRLIQLREQDEAHWALAVEWQASGIELATHSDSHCNLAERRLSPDDLRREIGASAALIEARTGAPVRTLVLPFGNGASDSYAGRLQAPIVDACREAGIGIVAGIGGGRVPLVPAPASEQPVYFVGRVGPMADDFDSIFWEIAYWDR